MLWLFVGVCSLSIRFKICFLLFSLDVRVLFLCLFFDFEYSFSSFFSSQSFPLSFFESFSWCFCPISLSIFSSYDLKMFFFHSISFSLLLFHSIFYSLSLFFFESFSWSQGEPWKASPDLMTVSLPSVPLSETFHTFRSCSFCYSFYVCAFASSVWSLCGPLLRQSVTRLGDLLTLWTTFQSLWQQLFGPNCQCVWEIFCKDVKKFIFLLKSFLGNFYRHLCDFLLVTLAYFLLLACFPVCVAWRVLNLPNIFWYQDFETWFRSVESCSRGQFTLGTLVNDRNILNWIIPSLGSWKGIVPSSLS